MIVLACVWRKGNERVVIVAKVKARRERGPKIIFGGEGRVMEGRLRVGARIGVELMKLNIFLFATGGNDCAVRFQVRVYADRFSSVDNFLSSAHPT